ncbi:hypothetical protein A9Q89_04560 [Gammaproteobacteria bacterium 53_120_T64]|nr:hypothetical protein A9Q89_04560 [Gammaproteobacteria bacterium 53_120_T64]
MAYSVEIEIISKVEILPTKELALILESEGKPSYQHVYRAAAGVYWDNEIYGFKSTEPKDFSYPKWFQQIIEVVKSEMGIQLQLANTVSWVNVPEEVKNAITQSSAT